MNAPTTPIRRQGQYKYPTKKILLVVSNPAELKGFPVGFFAEELTRPFFEFVQAGHEVEVVSPKGGPVRFDVISDPEDPNTAYPNELVTIGFTHHASFSKLLENTKSISDVNVADYDAISVAGGGAPLVTFKDDVALHELIADFYEQGKVVGMICHGSCLMLWTRLSNGQLLADGKTWTGFPDSEEEMTNAAVGFTVNDYTIESEAKKNPNTTFESVAPNQPFAIRDGRLVTGQQQHSGQLYSQLIIDALAETDEAAA